MFLIKGIQFYFIQNGKLCKKQLSTFFDKKRQNEHKMNKKDIYILTNYGINYNIILDRQKEVCLI